MLVVLWMRLFCLAKINKSMFKYSRNLGTVDYDSQRTVDDFND